MGLRTEEKVRSDCVADSVEEREHFPTRASRIDQSRFHFNTVLVQDCWFNIMDSVKFQNCFES